MKSRNEKGAALLEVILSHVCCCLANEHTLGEEGDSEEGEISGGQGEELKVVQGADRRAIVYFHKENPLKEHHEFHEGQEKADFHHEKMIDLDAICDFNGMNLKYGINRLAIAAEIIIRLLILILISLLDLHLLLPPPHPGSHLLLILYLVEILLSGHLFLAEDLIESENERERVEQADDE